MQEAQLLPWGRAELALQFWVSPGPCASLSLVRVKQMLPATQGPHLHPPPLQATGHFIKGAAPMEAGLPARPCGSLPEARPLDWGPPPTGGREGKTLCLAVSISWSYNRNTRGGRPAWLSGCRAGDRGPLWAGLRPAPSREKGITTKDRADSVSTKRGRYFQRPRSPWTLTPSSWSPPSRAQAGSLRLAHGGLSPCGFTVSCDSS